MDELDEVAVPFRWDLVSPDQLGSLLAGAGFTATVGIAGMSVARSTML